MSHLLGRRGGGSTIPVGGMVEVGRRDSEHYGQQGRVVSAKPPNVRLVAHTPSGRRVG